jgi:hypothetical protein
MIATRSVPPVSPATSLMTDPTPASRGGKTPRIDSVARVVTAPVAKPIITIWIAVTR